MRSRGSAEASAGALSIAVTALLTGCASPSREAAATPPPGPSRLAPEKEFTRPASKPHGRADLFFHFDQLDHYYRVPGEFTHRLNGDQYGFDALSFIITETHPGGGPGLHVHDVEEAHVLLEGTARYRIGDQTLTVHAPYVARVPAGVPHTFINAGSTPFNLIAVFPSKHPGSSRIGPNPLVQAEHGEEDSRGGFLP
jgi:mannose-6-phosphate isomerase-like protein (cupin superfamily)